jgi:ribosomal protein S21
VRRDNLSTPLKYGPEMWVMLDDAIKSPDRQCDEAQELYEKHMRSLVESQARQAKQKRSSRYRRRRPSIGGRF